MSRVTESSPWCGDSAVLPSHAGEFKTHVLETIVGPVFNHIANTFVNAFVRRAAAVYAKAR